MEQEEEIFKPGNRIKDLKTDITFIMVGNVLYVSEDYCTDMVLGTFRFFTERKFNN